MNYLVSRHQGAIEFLTSRGYESPMLVNHASQSFIDSLTENDCVIGTLPIHLAEAVCAKGARFFNLTLDVPAEYRGKELSVELMEEFGARITEYRIVELGKRTRLADMASELRFIAKTLLLAGETVGRISTMVTKVYQGLHPEKYS
jgi:CRISPR-associated protein Csx16